MGIYMAEEGLVPALAIVSTARRARETWELAGAAFAQDIVRQDEPRIYEASAHAIRMSYTKRLLMLQRSCLSDIIRGCRFLRSASLTREARPTCRDFIENIRQRALL
jgi:hypothetical protein